MSCLTAQKIFTLFILHISLYHFSKRKRAILKADEEGKKKFRRELLFWAFSAQIRITVFVVRWIPFSLEIHNVHFDQNKNCTQSVAKLAQHTTPIAKTHRTATRFASEPTENLKMFINIHLRNITIPSRKHHRSITTHH